MSMTITFDAAKRFLDDKVGEWLYGEYDQNKLETFQTLYHIGPVRDYFDYLLDKRASEEYMDRYQLDYSDIHDPRKLKSTGSNISGVIASHGFNFISGNIKRLYR